MANTFVAAQCWYSAGDYEEIQSAMEDGHLLPRLHAHWLEGAEQREEQARVNGALPVRVTFDLKEFRRFCKHFGIGLDTKARQQFAALKAGQMQGDRDTH
jgi:hypothetical protein